ncbi:hypothetical protein VZ94_02105 [Methylocucumis oryzae]|uniref:Uncharacterized protein n=1 Tax=Methylocucumis oryzae TaxID=1632867 RepID=A0A0F3IQK3_9GAMM|nr:hypothetical protein VZ94_02105 [Methylocucumis oryzae]
MEGTVEQEGHDAKQDCSMAKRLLSARQQHMQHLVKQKKGALRPFLVEANRVKRLAVMMQ